MRLNEPWDVSDLQADPKVSTGWAEFVDPETGEIVLEVAIIRHKGHGWNIPMLKQTFWTYPWPQVERILLAEVHKVFKTPLLYRYTWKPHRTPPWFKGRGGKVLGGTLYYRDTRTLESVTVEKGGEDDVGMVELY